MVPAFRICRIKQKYVYEKKKFANNSNWLKLFIVSYRNYQVSRAFQQVLLEPRYSHNQLVSMLTAHRPISLKKNFHYNCEKTAFWHELVTKFGHPLNWSVSVWSSFKQKHLLAQIAYNLVSSINLRSQGPVSMWNQRSHL